MAGSGAQVERGSWSRIEIELSTHMHQKKKQAPKPKPKRWTLVNGARARDRCVDR